MVDLSSILCQWWWCFWLWNWSRTRQNVHHYINIMLDQLWWSLWRRRSLWRYAHSGSRLSHRPYLFNYCGVFCSQSYVSRTAMDVRILRWSPWRRVLGPNTTTVSWSLPTEAVTLHSGRLCSRRKTGIYLPHCEKWRWCWYHRLARC